MGRKSIVTVGVIAMTLGLIALGGAAAGAAAGPPATGSGITTCNVTGTLTFRPPLAGVNGGTSTATVSAKLSRCIDDTHGRISFVAGRLQGLVGTVSPANCTSIAIAHVAPPIAGGSVSWTPHAKLIASGGVSFPAGGATVVTIGGVTFLQVSYAGGSVTTGSFANSGETSLTVTSSQNDAQLADKCSARKGLSVVGFRGTSTL